MNLHHKKFKNDITISGSLTLEQYVHVPSQLKLLVHIKKDNSLNEFTYHQFPGGNLTYSILVRDLVAGILKETDFLEFLKTQNTN